MSAHSQNPLLEDAIKKAVNDRNRPLPDLSIRARLKKNLVISWPCETSEGELDGGDFEPGEGGFGAGLEVLGEPPRAAEPGEGAFDDPAAGQHVEASRARGSVDDFQCLSGVSAYETDLTY